VDCHAFNNDSVVRQEISSVETARFLHPQGKLSPKEAKGAIHPQD
jgi:hypothetical protein